MLRKTPVEFDFLECHPSGLWKLTGVLRQGCIITFILWWLLQYSSYS